MENSRNIPEKSKKLLDNGVYPGFLAPECLEGRNQSMVFAAVRTSNFWIRQTGTRCSLMLSAAISMIVQVVEEGSHVPFTPTLITVGGSLVLTEQSAPANPLLHVQFPGNTKYFENIRGKQGWTANSHGCWGWMVFSGVRRSCRLETDIRYQEP